LLSPYEVAMPGRYESTDHPADKVGHHRWSSNTAALHPHNCEVIAIAMEQGKLMLIWIVKVHHDDR